MDCIFCKIVKGEIPCHKIYEDKKFLAFLDIANDVEGHTLVVPKQHVKDMNECGEKLFLGAMAVAKKIAGHYISLGYDSTNLYIVGEDVKHLHIHILPRRVNDGVKVKFEVKKLDRDLAKLAEKLRMN